MEELKQEQEMRERRNHDREQWRDGRPSEISAVIDFISFCVYNVERVLGMILLYLLSVKDLFLQLITLY